MKNISIIYMAAGHSIRFGRNKLIEVINDKYLFQHSLDIILEMNFDEIIVVSNTKEVMDYAKRNNLKFFKNNISHLGQGTTIKMGVANCKTNNHYMFLTGDMPNLNRSAISGIVEEFIIHHNITIPRVRNKTYNPVIYPNEFRKKLLSLPDNKTGKSIISDYDKITYVEFKDMSLFRDIDYLEDIY